MKTLRSAATAAVLIGLLSSLASHAEPQDPPRSPQKPGAAAAAGAAQNERMTPEEAKRRRDWAVDMHTKRAPNKGCFTATYPAAEWRQVQCVPAPNLPFIPRRGPRPFIVGNGDDILAVAPSGTITQAFGHFENPVNVTSESGMINNTGAAVNNAYSLQINTNFMISTACATSPNAGCRGWEQWVHFNNGTTGVAFIQYWLIQFNAACPAGWIQFTFPASTDIYCFRNNTGGGVAVPNQPITNIANWTLSGTATTTGDSVGMFDGTTLHTQAGDNSVNAAANWTEAEFNIFGPAGGSQANFNNGAQVNARTQIVYGGNAAPNCATGGTTGETNNLSFGPNAPMATAPGPAVIFQESTAGGAAANCAAAATIGDTHLRTFNNLFYDFQAAGDFTLAEVATGFEVQTRQVSGAPTWPNATINSAVAARLGKTTVAICSASSEAPVMIDGKPTAVAQGKPLDLPEGSVMRRVGNVYDIVDADGNSVRATLNSYGGTNWIDVAVGLGRWPSPVKGLIANVNGNVNQIATRDNVVLTNPFNFDELYRRFADSWRVSGNASLLSACGGRVAAGPPTRTFYAADLAEDVRAKARGVCVAAGVKQGDLLEACTLDVAVIGRDEAARVFVDTPQPAAVGTITGGGGGSALATRWWLILLFVIVLIIIVWLIMRKKP